MSYNIFVPWCWNSCVQNGSLCSNAANIPGGGMLGGSMIIRCKDLRQIKLDFYDCNDFINVADSLEKLCAIGMDNDKNYSALRYDDFKLFGKLFLDFRKMKMTVYKQL